MSDSDLITILHLSDFHYSKRKSREQGIVVDALIDDLKGLCIGHRKPDLILFTGDLVHVRVRHPQASRGCRSPGFVALASMADSQHEDQQRSSSISYTTG